MCIRWRITVSCFLCNYRTIYQSGSFIFVVILFYRPPLCFVTSISYGAELSPPFNVSTELDRIYKLNIHIFWILRSGFNSTDWNWRPIGTFCVFKRDRVGNTPCGRSGFKGVYRTFSWTLVRDLFMNSESADFRRLPCREFVDFLYFFVVKSSVGVAGEGRLCYAVGQVWTCRIASSGLLAGKFFVCLILRSALTQWTYLWRHQQLCCLVHGILLSNLDLPGVLFLKLPCLVHDLFPFECLPFSCVFPWRKSLLFREFFPEPWYYFLLIFLFCCWTLPFINQDGSGSISHRLFNRSCWRWGSIYGRKATVESGL